MYTYGGNKCGCIYDIVKNYHNENTIGGNANPNVQLCTHILKVLDLNSRVHILSFPTIRNGVHAHQRNEERI